MQRRAAGGACRRSLASIQQKEHRVSLVGSLIAISLLLLAALGIAGALLMGRSSRNANADDPRRHDD